MLRAVALVVSKVGGDPKYLNNVTLSVNYSNEYSDPTTSTILYYNQIDFFNFIFFRCHQWSK